MEPTVTVTYCSNAKPCIIFSQGILTDIDLFHYGYNVRNNQETEKYKILYSRSSKRLYSCSYMLKLHPLD